MKTQSQIHHTLNKLLSKNKVEATEQYEVHLKNGAETKIVKFDKDGKVVG